MTRCRGPRLIGLYSLVLLVVLSTIVNGVSIAEESPRDAPADVERYELIDLDLKLEKGRGRRKIESGLGYMIDDRVAQGRGSEGIRVIVELDYIDDGLFDSLDSLGVEIETSHGKLFQVIATPGQIIRCARVRRLNV